MAIPVNPPMWIKVKVREIVILVVAGILATAAGQMPLAPMARTGLVTFVVGIGVMLALGRSIRSGGPFEAYFVTGINFWLSPRVYMRGGKSTGEFRQIELDPESWGSYKGVVRALPLSWGGWLGVLIVILVSVIIAGVWTGEL